MHDAKVFYILRKMFLDITSSRPRCFATCFAKRFPRENRACTLHVTRSALMVSFESVAPEIYCGIAGNLAHSIVTCCAACFARSVVFRCRAEGQGGASRAGGGGESSWDSLLTPCRRRNLRKRFLEARRDTHATYPRQESCRAATKPGDFLLATGSRLDVPWFERRVLSLSPLSPCPSASPRV